MGVKQVKASYFNSCDFSNKFPKASVDKSTETDKIIRNGITKVESSK